MSIVDVFMRKQLDNLIEQELLNHKSSRPYILLLKKYGIVGVRATEFIKDLALVVEQMNQGDDK